jgi:hypothetical protein
MIHSGTMVYGVLVSRVQSLAWANLKKITELSSSDSVHLLRQGGVYQGMVSL